MKTVLVYSASIEAKKKALKRSAYLLSTSLLMGLTIHLMMAFTGLVPTAAWLASSPPITETQSIPIAPTSISIPALNLAASIQPVGLNTQNEVELPPDEFTVGWYNQGGSLTWDNNHHLILTGHYDSKTGPAIFYSLTNLSSGSEIHLQDANDFIHTFLVTSSARYAVETFPLKDIFSPTPTPTLILITCDGIFDTDSQNYSHRLVIYATPAHKNP
jgi:sortase (surface protein transpeptidase)